MDLLLFSINFELNVRFTFGWDDVAVCDTEATTGATVIRGLDLVAREASFIRDVNFAY